MIEWKIETRKISDLKPYHKNPRQITKEQFEHIQKSLEKFGLIDKPIINTDNTIIGGHQRLHVLKKMKVKEVEVYIPHRLLEDKEVEELCIRLNRNHGEFDEDMLANQFNISDLNAWGFSLDDFEIDLQEEPEKECEKCPICNRKMKKKN